LDWFNSAWSFWLKQREAAGASIKLWSSQLHEARLERKQLEAAFNGFRQLSSAEFSLTELFIE
jgi:hypothetical protein